MPPVTPALAKLDARFVGGISAALAGGGYCMGFPNPAFHMWIQNRMFNTPVDSLLNQSDIFGAMHPNAAGQAAAGAVIANAIASAIPVATTASADPGNHQVSTGTRVCPSARPKCCETNDDGSCARCVPARTACFRN